MERAVIIDKLREHGYRVTKQRRVLLDVILAQDCSSCKEIYYKANAVDSSVGVATVYRMVNVLEDIGALDRKNMYKLSYDAGNDAGNEWVIEYEDSTYRELAAEEWKRVIFEGLKVCGYDSGKRIAAVKGIVSGKTELAEV